MMQENNPVEINNIIIFFVFFLEALSTSEKSLSSCRVPLAEHLKTPKPFK